MSRRHRWRIHAPGPIREFAETPHGVDFHVSGWPKTPWRVFLNGEHRPVEVRINGAPPQSGTVTHHRADGWLILTPADPAKIEVFRKDR